MISKTSRTSRSMASSPPLTPPTDSRTATASSPFLCSRAEFEKVDLARVEPKACFKALSGVSAASLAALAPIPPIITIDKSDRRFVDGREIADTLDASVNLAAMDWEDFEHLIRELFEK